MYQIFALDSAVVEAQTMLSLHRGFLFIAMYHHRETILSNQINALWLNREAGSELKIVRFKVNLQLSHGGPSYSQASGTYPLIKVQRRSHHLIWGLTYRRAIK